MSTRALMLQGVGSDVGKSVITAALCRIAVRRGLSAAPFKAQNMSNNAAACAGGGEIGRAQALQARAAGLAPHTDMNPVLIKPETDRRAQVVVHGRVSRAMDAADYMTQRAHLMDAVLESFERLAGAHELILVEGAGSPAEINLRERDIANMGFARRAGVPVCLIGDIDRGGVIASLVGTRVVLAADDAAMIRGFVVNRFRGDPQLFDDGVVHIEKRTGWPCFGIIPWLPAAARLPAEDAVVLEQAAPPPRGAAGRGLRVAAPMLSRIANFDDADPLKLEPGVDFQWIPPGRRIPRDVDVIILFGTKSTLGDLAFLRAQGWDRQVLDHARRGGRVLGICGGYQLLGKWIADPEGVDGPPGKAPGLGLLDVETVMTTRKRTLPARGVCTLTGAPVNGYEIHSGVTRGADTARPVLLLQPGLGGRAQESEGGAGRDHPPGEPGGDAAGAHAGARPDGAAEAPAGTRPDGGRPDGARSADGRIEGIYLHGAFAGDAFRRVWLDRAGGQGDAALEYDAAVEAALDALADGVEAALDVDALLACAETPGWSPDSVGG